MEREQVDIDSMIQHLSTFEEIDCRICLRKRGEEWHLVHLIGDVNRPESIKSEWVQAYSDVTFIRGVIVPAELSSWLTDLRGEFREFAFQVPEIHEHVQQERYSTGLAGNHLYHLSYPFSLYLLSPSNYQQERPDPFTPLVKAGLPSFLNYNTAFYRFMLDADGLGRDIPQNFVIRIAHPEAWISSVETEPDAIRVILEGGNCRGTRLTVGGPEGILINEVIDNDGGEQRFEINDAHSNNLWAVLSRDDQWIDWRNVHKNRAGSINISGVQPANLSANIEQLRLQGENEQLEYKSRVPDKPEKFLKTVAAFANGSGGIILIGIADDGAVEGIDLGKYEDIGKYTDGIVNSIRDRIVPAPMYELAKCVVDNKEILAVFVKEGEDAPYGLKNKSSLSIYVRRHGTTFDATPNEIRALGAKHQSSAENYNRYIL